MGVTGLWPILAPSARPTPLPTLNRKRLAVDASIWIYQFLKAVRDNEGNALPNSHIVGFFRRICKLLYFGIKPVFVFDGGAPILKRQTILDRRQRREGKREDVARTAVKLMALQMKRMEEENKMKEREPKGQQLNEEDAIPAEHELVYVGEMGLSAQERSKNRKLRRTDAYDLPELENGIEGMGQPNDPRIMSTEELKEYAQQFDNGDEINLYDFCNIDFDGDFFMSLPVGDRYNILNAARLRSRLRMGLSKDQLEIMFPDRMAFSRFQIERVRERNELTQRLMNLNGMNGDVVGVIGGRIAGEMNREYVLVKNNGAEGGWALGVVNTATKEVGGRNIPIDVDSLGQPKSICQDSEDEDEFEDVPVVGLNRLPTVTKTPHISLSDFQPDEIENFMEQYSDSQERGTSNEPNSLFVLDNNLSGRYKAKKAELNQTISISLQQEGDLGSEDEHVQEAIALSFQKSHAQLSKLPEDEEYRDIPLLQYEQQAVQTSQPLIKASGNMISHIVNNRANAAVPQRKAIDETSDTDDEIDLKAALAIARTKKASEKPISPVVLPEKHQFPGILPFEKLGSIFGKKDPAATTVKSKMMQEDMAGGFDNNSKNERSPRPLPPWLTGQDDICSAIEMQRKRDLELYAADRDGAADVVAKVKRKGSQDNDPVIIDSSDEEGLEILDFPPLKLSEQTINFRAQSLISSASLDGKDMVNFAAEQTKGRDTIDNLTINPKVAPPIQPSPEGPASPELIVAPMPATTGTQTSPAKSTPSTSSPIFQDVEIPDLATIYPLNSPPDSQYLPLSIENDYDLERAAIDAGFDDINDPDDEELLAQLALEAEEHGRFASTLNNKSELENQRDYETELKALRSKQKNERRDADEVSQTMITECQTLLRLFGIPYITAPMEAEAQCAELVRLGLVDGVVTDDCDIFLFGGTRVYKNMFNSNKFVECYLASNIEKELSLSREQLISIAHLLGSDYTEGLPGIGPVTALEIISEFPSISDFASWWSTAQHSTEPEESTFRKKFRRRQAAKLFLPPSFPSQAVTEAYWRPEVDGDKEAFQWGVPDLELLRGFLMTTISWSSAKTDEVLVPVIRDMNRRAEEGTQSNITQYFNGSLGTGVRGQVGVVNAPGGSKRMREAVGRLKAKKKKDGRLDKTFADEAREWMQRENSEKNNRNAGQMTSKPQRKVNGIRCKRANTALPEDEEIGDCGEPQLQVDEENDSNIEISSVTRGKSKKKAKAPRKKAKLA